MSDCFLPDPRSGDLEDGALRSWRSAPTNGTSTVSVQSVVVHGGSYALKATEAGAGGFYTMETMWYYDPFPLPAVAPGENAVIECWARIDNDDHIVRFELALLFWELSGPSILAAYLSDADVILGEWTHVLTDPFSVPAGAEQLVLALHAVSSDFLYLDGLGIQPGSTFYADDFCYTVQAPATWHVGHLVTGA